MPVRRLNRGGHQWLLSQALKAMFQPYVSTEAPGQRLHDMSRPRPEHFEFGLSSEHPMAMMADCLPVWILGRLLETVPFHLDSTFDQYKKWPSSALGPGLNEVDLAIVDHKLLLSVLAILSVA